MDLTPHQEAIYSGTKCPYCSSETKVVSEEFIYGRSYKNKSMICCVNFPKCDSYCGTHEEDGSSFGRLANKQLRQYKKVSHDAFDKIWMQKLLTRNEAYEWFSEELNIPLDYTHIGFFGIENCKKAITLSNEYMKQHESNI